MRDFRLTFGWGRTGTVDHGTTSDLMVAQPEGLDRVVPYSDTQNLQTVATTAPLWRVIVNSL
jgi:hypothetical protein